MNADVEPHWDASALLTIDLQRDFLSDGAFAVPGTTEVLPAVVDAVRAFRAARRPIVHVIRLYLADGSNADISRRTTIRAGASIVRPGSAGARLASGLLPGNVAVDPEPLLRGELQQVAEAEHVLFKPRWNAFYATPLEAWLRSRNVDTVAVAGCNFPNCPRATLFGASERDFRAAAVSDAISGWTPTSEVELRGIGVCTVDSATLARALSGATRARQPAAEARGGDG